MLKTACLVGQGMLLVWHFVFYAMDNRYAEEY